VQNQKGRLSAFFSLELSSVMNDYDDFEDEFSDEELHEFAALVKNKTELKKKFPEAYAQTVQREMLKEVFMRPRQENRVSMLCYVWVLVGEFYRDMTIIKFGIGQKDDNGKRMRTEAKKRGFKPNLVAMVTTRKPALHLEQKLRKIGLRPDIDGYDYRAVTDKELNKVLNLMREHALDVQFMKKV